MYVFRFLQNNGLIYVDGQMFTTGSNVGQTVNLNNNLLKVLPVDAFAGLTTSHV